MKALENKKNGTYMVTEGIDKDGKFVYKLHIV